MGKLLCEFFFGTFGVEMRAYGQKLVKFCKHTHTHASKLVVEIILYKFLHLSRGGVHISHILCTSDCVVVCNLQMFPCSGIDRSCLVFAGFFSFMHFSWLINLVVHICSPSSP